MSFETLNAKPIFFVMYACPETSVPEKVLDNWYEHFSSSSRMFWSSKDELSSGHETTGQVECRPWWSRDIFWSGTEKTEMKNGKSPC